MTSREQFEAWFLNRFPRSRHGVDTWDNKKGSVDYIGDYTRLHWETWQASREEGIALPAATDDDLIDFRSECEEHIRTAGYKVKGD
ncbi:hypothetical protein RJ498_000843 [Pluralibacter gergoviae]